MKDKIKSAFSFALCTSAFSQRNVTSIGLVIVFMVVYVLAGGKITTDLPRLSRKGQFGVPARSVTNELAAKAKRQRSALTDQESKKILGELPSDKKERRQAIRAKYGSLFTDEERKEAESEKIDEDGLVKGVKFSNRREKWLLERSEKKQVDSLSKIEDRLRIKKTR